MLMVKDGPIMTIKDAYIVDQECTGTSTEMASTAIARLQMELFKKKIIGQDDNVKLAHFHTHCTFGVFWSGTDMELRRTMVAGTDYSVALVINHKGEALAAIDINGDFPLSISNLPIEIVREESELVKACKAEVLAKVKQPAAQYTSWMNGQGTFDPSVDPLRGYRGGKRGRPRKDPLDPKWKEIDEDVYAMESRLLGRTTSDAEMEAVLAERRMLADQGLYSDEFGTWQNVGGQVVKVDEPQGGGA
jgi:hypothetical protein